MLLHGREIVVKIRVLQSDHHHHRHGVWKWVAFRPRADHMRVVWYSIQLSTKAICCAIVFAAEVSIQKSGMESEGVRRAVRACNYAPRSDVNMSVDTGNT